MFEIVDKKRIRELIKGGMVFSLMGSFFVIFLGISMALNFSTYLPSAIMILSLCIIFNSIGLGCISEALWRSLRSK